MPGPPTSSVVAGLEAVVIAAFFLALGWLIVDAIMARWTDRLARLSLSFFGFALFALAVMLLHVVTRGRVLSEPLLSRGIALTVFVVLAVLRGVRRTDASVESDCRRGRAALLLMTGAGVIVWCLPVFLSLPLETRGDTNTHAMFTNQLLNGEILPSGAITGDIPNFYPWLFHSMLALVSAFTPGGRAHHALSALQLIQVCGLIMAAFGLGRALTQRLSTGVFLALLGGLTGGVGFVLLRGIDVVVGPPGQSLRYSGDLLAVRSPNISFYELTPPLPRDVAFVLLVSALAFIALALARPHRGLLIASGVALGMSGLTGAESFFVGCAVALALVVAPPGLPRGHIAAYVMLPALAVYSLWLVPQIVHYVALDGYVNLTRQAPVSLPPGAILVSWGVTTPLAVWGAIVWARRWRRDPAVRLVVAVVAAASAVLLSSLIVSALLGEAFLSLGRVHRYWPLVHFGFVLFAALGATSLAQREYSRPAVAIAAGALVVLAAIPSPVVASLGMTRVPGRHYVLSAIDGDEGALFNLVAPVAGGRCVAAVGTLLDFELAAYTGYRLVLFVAPRPFPGNRARIRWRAIYEQIIPEAQRLADNKALVRGSVSPDAWRSIASRYGVDAVVVRNSDASAPAFAAYSKERAQDGPYTVVRVTRCGGAGP